MRIAAWSIVMLDLLVGLACAAMTFWLVMNLFARPNRAAGAAVGVVLLLHPLLGIRWCSQQEYGKALVYSLLALAAVAALWAWLF